MHFVAISDSGGDDWALNCNRYILIARLIKFSFHRLGPVLKGIWTASQRAVNPIYWLWVPRGAPHTNISLLSTNMQSRFSHQILLPLLTSFLKLISPSLPRTTGIWPMSTTSCKPQFIRSILLPPR